MWCDMVERNSFTSHRANFCPIGLVVRPGTRGNDEIHIFQPI